MGELSDRLVHLYAWLSVFGESPLERERAALERIAYLESLLDQTGFLLRQRHEPPPEEWRKESEEWWNLRKDIKTLSEWSRSKKRNRNA